MWGKYYIYDYIYIYVYIDIYIYIYIYIYIPLSLFRVLSHSFSSTLFLSAHDELGIENTAQIND